MALTCDGSYLTFRGVKLLVPIIGPAMQTVQVLLE